MKEEKLKLYYSTIYNDYYVVKYCYIAFLKDINKNNIIELDRKYKVIDNDGDNLIVERLDHNK